MAEVTDYVNELSTVITGLNESVTTLNDNVTALNEKFAQLEQTVNTQSQEIEAMKQKQVNVEQLETAVSSQAQQIDELKQKSMNLNTKKANGMLLKKSRFEISKVNYEELITRRQTRFEIQKAINAAYALGNVGMANEPLKYITSDYKPSLYEYFNVETTDKSQITINDIQNLTVYTSSDSQGCFTVTESLMNINASQYNPYTIRVQAPVCDTTLEDYEGIEDVIDDIFATQLKRGLSENLYNELLNGVPGNTTPSYTALAGQIVETTIFDLAVIHQMDAVSQSNGTINPNVMFLNPIDYTRLVTQKTNANANIYSMYGIVMNGISFVPNNVIPQGTYVLCDTTKIDVLIKRDVTLELVTGSHSEASAGNKLIIGSMRAFLILPATYAYASIFGTINTELANY